jgi:hypothetical protein
MDRPSEKYEAGALLERVPSKSTKEPVSQANEDLHKPAVSMEKTAQYKGRSPEGRVFQRRCTQSH